MIKRFFVVCAWVGYSFAASSTEMVDLTMAYKDALLYDPTYQAELSQHQSALEAHPQALSALLPSLQASGDASNERFANKFTGSPSTVTHSGTHNIVANLSQPLFNYAAIARLRQSNAVVEQADARLNAAQLDLMIRLSRAYFAVLESEDNLRFALAEKRANARQLDQAKERFKVGLDAITSVYDAQAQYDRVSADAIVSENQVKNNLERLREITGHYYKKLKPIKPRIPLYTPEPNRIDDWVDATARNNYVIKIAEHASEAAKKNIQVAYAGHFPVVSLTANYIDNSAARLSFGKADSETSNVGVRFAMPIYEGGLIASQTRQAVYDYNAALANLERAQREQLSIARQSYNNVIAGISAIKAAREAIVSSQAATDSNEAAMKVGTRTIVDLLNAQRDLYQTQRAHAATQYAYINNFLALKQSAGSLSPEDLGKINEWLSTTTYNVNAHYDDEAAFVKKIQSIRPKDIDQFLDEQLKEELKKDKELKKYSPESTKKVDKATQSKTNDKTIVAPEPIKSEAPAAPVEPSINTPKATEAPVSTNKPVSPSEKGTESKA